MYKSDKRTTLLALVVVAGCSANSATSSDTAIGSDAADSDGAAPSDAGPDASAPVPCDPLAPLATTLGTILGVGKDASGTLYVADTEMTGQNRVFVSEGNTLVRQHVLGSGENGAAQYTFSFEGRDSDGSDARALLLNLQGGTASAMALGPANSRSFLSDASVGDTPLTVVDPSSIAGFAVLDLPGVVQYVGDVSNGDVLVVTAPMDLYSSSSFRIFYGPASHEVEGVITNFSQALSGYPQITFIIGGATYTMSISVVASPDGGLFGSPGPGMLSIAGGPSLGFTLRFPTPTTLAGFRFACLAR